MDEKELTMPELIQAALDPDTEANALDHKELDAELLGEYAKAKQNLADLEKIVDMLRAQIVRLAGDRRGAIHKGEYTLILEPKRGAVTVDWTKYVEEMIGAEAIKELEILKQAVKDRKAECTYMKVAKDTVNVKVVKGEALPEY